MPTLPMVNQAKARPMLSCNLIITSSLWVNERKRVQICVQRELQTKISLGYFPTSGD